MKDIFLTVLIYSALAFVLSKSIDSQFSSNEGSGSAVIQKKYTSYRRFYIETNEYSAGFYEPLPFGDTHSLEKRAIYPQYARSGLYQPVPR